MDQSGGWMWIAKNSSNKAWPPSSAVHVYAAYASPKQSLGCLGLCNVPLNDVHPSISLPSLSPCTLPWRKEGLQGLCSGNCDDLAIFGRLRWYHHQLLSWVPCCCWWWSTWYESWGIVILWKGKLFIIVTSIQDLSWYILIYNTDTCTWSAKWSHDVIRILCTNKTSNTDDDTSAK